MYLKLPNVLTYTRIISIPVVTGLFFLDDPMGSWLAFSVYTYACITDFFDGYLARAWHQQSALGRFLDPIADKLLVAGVLFALLGADRITGVHIIPAGIILGREILVSGLREFLIELRVGMPVSQLAKWKTAIQMICLGFLLVGPNGPDFWSVPTLDIGIYGLWLAALLTLITGFDYLYVGLKHITETDHAPAGRHPDADGDLDDHGVDDKL
jgi:cardiolipin synthase